MIGSAVCDFELPYLSKTSIFPTYESYPVVSNAKPVFRTGFPLPVQRWPPWVWFVAFAQKCQTLVLCLLVVLQTSPVSKWNITRLTFIWFVTRARRPMLWQTRFVIILPVALFTLIHRRLSMGVHVSHDMLRIQKRFVANPAKICFRQR